MYLFRTVFISKEIAGMVLFITCKQAIPFSFKILYLENYSATLPEFSDAAAVV